MCGDICVCDNMSFSLTGELAKDFAKDGVDHDKLTYKDLRKAIADQREFERRFRPRRRGWGRRHGYHISGSAGASGSA